MSDKSLNNKGKIIKYLEWNLHAMGNPSYNIPDFVVNHLKDVDIFVLVEIRIEKESPKWDEFEECLKEFNLYYSPNDSKHNYYNQICIGIRKNIKCDYIYSPKYIDNPNIPELLQVNISIQNKNKNKKISIIGTRIKTKTDTKSEQYQYLLENYFKNKKIDAFICLGDFNAVYKTLLDEFSRNVSIFGPRIINDYHSFVHENGDKCGLDWIITKGIKNVYNGYEDREISKYATYDWSFVTEKNGYGKRTKDDYLSDINGLPDHAILKGMIKIEF